MSRSVVESDGFAAQLAAQLGTARGPRGEPTVAEFAASDLVSARRYPAEAFDVLRIVDGGYRMLTVVEPITHVPYFHIACHLDPDNPNVVVMSQIDIGWWSIDDREDTAE